MTQLKILHVGYPGRCKTCGDEQESAFGGVYCPNCENEKKRMDEFDELLKADTDVANVWNAFEASCDYRTNGAPKQRLSWMSIFCWIRENEMIHCHNDLGPMMARKYEKQTKRKHFTLKRLKGEK